MVKEIRPGITIDFEMFEVLYLSIRVYDRETVIGDDYDECKYFEVKFIPIFVDRSIKNGNDKSCNLVGEHLRIEII